MFAKARILIGVAAIALATAFSAPSLAATPPADSTKPPMAKEVPPMPGKHDAGKPGQPGKPGEHAGKPSSLKQLKLAVRMALKQIGYAKIGKIKLLNRPADKKFVYGPKRIPHAGPVLVARVISKKGNIYRVFLDPSTMKQIARKRIGKVVQTAAR
jgi:hypothetical protein